MLTAVVLAFAAAAAAPAALRVFGRATGWVLAIVPAALTVYFAARLPSVLASGPIVERRAWVPELGVSLSFHLDGLSLLFALLICGIGALIVVYAAGYLDRDSYLGRALMVLLAFLGSMLGLVLADDVITLFVFWELTSFTSYLLIGHDHERAEARAAALQALLVTGLGGLVLLAGLLLLANVGGSTQLSEIAARGDLVRGHALYAPILLFVLVGAFSKSAQFPFHFWLPGAMQAPTPVSAYLHSATMVKAGIYLLARLHPALGGTDLWVAAVAPAGAMTMLIGAMLALRETDLKLMLAYSTIMVLGSLTFLLGLGHPYALQATIVFLIAHSLYKGALFLVVGAVDHEAGTRDVTQVSGLRRAMPITFVAALVAGLSAAGLPPVLGFISKELVYEATLGADRWAALATAAVVLANALTVVVAGLVALRPFLGSTVVAPSVPHEAPLSLWLGPVVLGALALFAGAIPFGLNAIVGAAAAATAGAPIPVELVIWHGVNAALLLSLLTVALGVAGYFAWSALRAALTRAEWLIAVGPARWYQWGLSALVWVAATQTRILQHGKLRLYVLVILGTTVLTTGYTLVTRVGVPTIPRADNVTLIDGGIAVIILAAAVGALIARSRLNAIISLGVVGYGIALTFIVHGAPDLAMTQFLVETLIVIIVALVILHLPHFPPDADRLTRWSFRDALVAGAAGVLMAAMVVAIGNVPFDATTADYYSANSLEGGHGRNIVNVILVDFRALDTLGEITVLAVAGIGVHALLKLRAKARRRRVQ